MVRTLKNRRQNRYQYDKNRKNLKKQLKKKSSGGKVKCPEIKNEMLKGKSLKDNINNMGLVFNSKREFKIPSYKDSKVLSKFGFKEEDISDGEENQEIQTTPRVADKLQKEAKELRASKFRLSNNQVKIISYFMDKYGLKYGQMVTDHKNIDQLTWRQFRQKCRKLMSIPEQFSKYLEERNLLEADIDEKDPKWIETGTDDED